MYKVLVTTKLINGEAVSVHSIVIEFAGQTQADLAIEKIKEADKKINEYYVPRHTAIALY